MLRIRGPLGTFFLRENSNRPALLIGGGTGFAPLKGMLEHAFYTSVDKPLHLFWGVRTKRDLYLKALPEQWQQSHSNFHYTAVLSEPGTADGWQGETGFVSDSIVRQYPDLSDYDVYMSGPPVMVEAGHSLFLKHGLDESRFFSDAFEYAALSDKLK